MIRQRFVERYYVHAPADEEGEPLHFIRLLAAYGRRSTLFLQHATFSKRCPGDELRHVIPPSVADAQSGRGAR